MEIYIAGKIGGLPIDVYTKFFFNAQTEYEKLGYFVVNPVNLPHDHNKTWKAYGALRRRGF